MELSESAQRGRGHILKTELAVSVSVALALIFLLVLIVLSPPRLVYDEPGHLGLAKQMRQIGLVKALTSPNNYSAVGPLYPVLHLVFAPLTNLSAPAVRLINFFFLVVVIGITTGDRSGVRIGGYSRSAAVLLSVPFLWPTSGMALTELPALLPFTLFVLIFGKALRRSSEEEPSAYLGTTVLAGLAGCFLGLSILGRQTYLATLLAAFVPICCRRSSLVLATSCTVTALLVCSWLFFVWGGLVPPSLSRLDSGIHLDHAVLSTSYVATATLFLNPGWLKPASWRSGLILLLGGFLSACFVYDFQNPPARSLLMAVFGEQTTSVVGFVLHGFMAALGLQWCWRNLRGMWFERATCERVFLYAVLFLLTAAPAKIGHGFSSRYVVGLLPVLFLVVGFPLKFSGFAVARIVCGSLLGGAILWTYYGQA